jgi:hypothetical protein
MTAIWNQNVLPVAGGDQTTRGRTQEWLAEASLLLERVERPTNHYSVLNVNERAAPAEIHAAYRETVVALTRAFNDLRDVVPGDQLQGFKPALAHVRDAYNVLSSPARRLAYDESLRKAAAEAESLTGFEIVADDLGYTAAVATHSGLDGHSDAHSGADLVSHRITAARNQARPRMIADHRGRQQSVDPDAADPDANRRRTDRTGLSLMGRITRTDDQGRNVQEMVKTLEVSKTGASFLTRYSPKVGNVLHVALPMPLRLRLHGHAEAAYITYALVRRVRPFDEEHSVVGVEFLGARPPRQYQEQPGAIFDVDNWRGADRRRWPRVIREEMVALRYLDKSSAVVGVSLGTTENVGRRGARIRLEKPAPEFHMVRIMCAGVAFESLAALCRSYRGPDTTQRLCVNFTDNEWPEQALS